jgi:DNA segregation ATPase FtsK/SpoIIIE-like protein
VTTVNNSTFTKFTDPYISNVGVTSPFSQEGADGYSYFDWNGALDGLSESEFALLMRTVELVVQAQTFSRERLRYALRISEDTAATLSRSIELLGIISAGEPNAQRRVLVSVRTLPVLLAKMLSGRDRLPSFASPEDLRIAS